MDLFMSAEARREVLKNYGQLYHLHVFIETGTNQGTTPWVLKDLFTKLYTIELHNGMWAAAVTMFADYPQVKCLYGDSALILPQILNEIDEAALVWLDGHYCGEGTAHAELSTPIRDELRILLQDQLPHVILVDDARVFEGGPEHDMYEHYADYPSLQWVEELAKKYGYSYELRDDIIRLVPV